MQDIVSMKYDVLNRLYNTALKYVEDNPHNVEEQFRMLKDLATCIHFCLPNKVKDNDEIIQGIKAAVLSED